MVNYSMVLAGKDGFNKEMDVHFVDDCPPHTYKVRQYARPKFQCNLHEDLNIIDRNFILKSNFYAFGKNILYYVENA